MEEDWALTKAAMAAADGAEGRVAAEGGAEAGRGQRLRRSLERCGVGEEWVGERRDAAAGMAWQHRLF